MSKNTRDVFIKVVVVLILALFIFSIVLPILTYTGR